MDSISHFIETNIHIIEDTLMSLERELQMLPQGTLRTIRHNNKYYYYQRIDNKLKYLPASDILNAEALARKSLIFKNIAVLKKNLSALRNCAKKYTPYDPDLVYESISSSCRSLIDARVTGNLKIDTLKASTASPLMFDKNISPITYPGDTDIQEWQAKPFESNPLYRENLIHTTPKGEKVRSKSESIIAWLLWKNKIPYKYEAPLHINGVTYYPDFVIMHPVTKKIYYWEHFGRVDDENYLFHMDNKIMQYRKGGIVPWDNLLVTYDTVEGSINPQAIEKIILTFLT